MAWLNQFKVECMNEFCKNRAAMSRISELEMDPERGLIRPPKADKPRAELARLGRDLSALNKLNS